MYVMVYLLNKNYLPWNNFHERFQNMNYDFDDFLRERLELQYTKQVFRMTPKSLRHMLKKIFTLQFTAEPPYDWIIQTLTKQLKEEIKCGPDG